MTRQSKQSAKHPNERQLLRQLAAAPIVDVLGILAGSGVSGGWSQGDTLWTLLVTFASWRVPGGELHTKELIVRRRVRERAIDRYRQLIKPDVVTRIRVRLVENSVFGCPEALLVKVVGRDASDAQMNAEVERLQKPVRFKDKNFGTFTLDRRINWFEAKSAWNGRKVRLNLAAVEPDDVDRALQAARKLWRSQKMWRAKVLAYAVQELLPLKNDLWLGDGETKLSAKQFQERMTLESISVSPDGSFDLWHDDGDLFCGHSIQICGSLAKGLTSADIPG